MRHTAESRCVSTYGPEDERILLEDQGSSLAVAAELALDAGLHVLTRDVHLELSLRFWSLIDGSGCCRDRVKTPAMDSLRRAALPSLTNTSHSSRTVSDQMDM